MAEHSKIKSGMYVRVLHNLEKTDSHWTVVEGMPDMIGHKFKVRKSTPSYISINDFYFHPDDVIVVDKDDKLEKETQNFHFNPEELVI